MLDNSLNSQGTSVTQVVPAAKQKSRNQLHRGSFFLHLRPKTYSVGQVSWKNTWHLGFLSVFFLVLECVTGVLLMVYYVPSPDGAYESIVRLNAQVPFGWLMRDLHRLGGECMIVVVVLHLVRVFLAGAYTRKAAMTWITGVGLLLCTLILAFSGYLLPWDQLAFWAVTIGTSMADAIPGIGQTVSVFLRGGQEIAQDGLLRFYLLHILAVPVVMLALVAVHYYRISRLHGISVPKNDCSDSSGHVPFLPDIALTELYLSVIILVVLIAACAWLYDAPFEHHADPRHTPAATMAPWYFLWLQGALKLGNSFVIGVCLPLTMLVVLLLIPLLDFSKSRGTVTIYLRGGLVLLVSAIGLGLSVYGFPRYGIEGGPVAKILQQFAPEESESPFRQIGWEGLVAGLYSGKEKTAELPEKFRNVRDQFFQAVQQLEGDDSIESSSGAIIVEEWQAGLKRITLRIQTTKKNVTEPESSEVDLFLYDREYGSRSASVVPAREEEGKA